MSEPAAIRATFAGFNKPVIGRRVVPLVFEVPIEEFEKVLRVLGTPDAASPQWCGIARVSTGGPTPLHGAKGREDSLTPPVEPNPDSAVQGRSPDGGAASGAAAPPKPNSTRAVMMAKDKGVWAFLSDRVGYLIDAEAKADVAIKELCGVRSKTELNDGAGAYRFGSLRDDFRVWHRAYGQ